MQVLKHKFFQIGHSLSSVGQSTTNQLTNKVPQPVKSQGGGFLNNNSVLKEKDNNSSKINDCNIIQKEREIGSTQPKINPKVEVRFDVRTNAGTGEDVRYEPAARRGMHRETDSRDSGVHVDSDLHQTVSTSATPLLSTSHFPPITKCVPPEDNSAKNQTRSDFNPVKIRRNVLLEGRRQWGEERPLGILNKPSLVNQTKYPLPEISEPTLQKRRGQPLSKDNLKSVIQKSEAAQFYLNQSRYSPLTSGKRSGHKLGFGSSAPRFPDRKQSIVPPPLPPPHLKGLGITKERQFGAKKDREVNLPLIAGRSGGDGILPSWFSGVKKPSGKQYST